MEEKKERTIEKAREYFHKFWYRKASLSDLIAEIGISKPTFYNYFKNKEQLFASVMLATYNEFQYEFTQRSKHASSAVERLEIFVRTYAWFLEHFPLYRDLYIPGNDLLPRWIKSRSSKDLFAEGVETVKGIILQGQEEGIFDTRLDSEAASLIVYNIVVSLLSQDLRTYQRKNSPPYQIQIDTLLHILGTGLTPPEPAAAGAHHLD
jgi:AcrR family transcriptional regulator